MKCPKCGYHSFDHLESCRKCGRDLRPYQARFGVGRTSTGRAETGVTLPAPPAPSPAVRAASRPQRGVPGPCSPLPASLRRRVAATLLDLLILALVLATFVATGALLLAPGQPLPLSLLLDWAIPCFLLLFTLVFGYFTLFHFLAGQTPGKMALRLRVESEDGGALLFSQAFLRSVGGLASLLVVGAGYVGLFRDRQRRGWNDRLAGSRVVAGVVGDDGADPAGEGE